MKKERRESLPTIAGAEGKPKTRRSRKTHSRSHENACAQKEFSSSSKSQLGSIKDQVAAANNSKTQMVTMKEQVAAARAEAYELIKKVSKVKDKDPTKEKQNQAQTDHKHRDKTDNFAATFSHRTGSSI